MLLLLLLLRFLVRLVEAIKEKPAVMMPLSPVACFKPLSIEPLGAKTIQSFRKIHTKYCLDRTDKAF